MCGAGHCQGSGLGKTVIVYVVLGEHSDDRSVAHDAIRVGRFLVGLLPAGDVQERGRGRLPLARHSF